MKHALAIALTVVSLASSAAAETAEPYPAAFAQALRRDGKFEDFLGRVMGPFRAAVNGAAILNPDAIKRFGARQDAGSKADALAHFITLDANSDAVVTRDEAGNPGDDSIRLIFVDPSAALFEADVDDDGRVTIAELYRRKEVRRPGATSEEDLAEYLALGDGKTVSAIQVLDRATSVFRSIDANGDATLSAQELRQVASRIPRRSPFRDIVPYRVCDLPKPSAQAETILLGAYEGDAMADVHVRDADEETTSSNIVVQSGDTPLYIVATSYTPQIWVLSGAVDRVEKLILSGRAGGRRSGAVGLPKERVAFSGGSDPQCIPYFHESGSKETVGAKQAFAASVGRQADRVGGAYRLSKMSVPDMAHETSTRRDRPPAPEGFNGALWKTALRFMPRGLMRFEPDAVVASQPAHRYEVLPQEFGLAQLVASGHLEMLGDRRFRIARPIAAFPAGLTGSHAVEFVLGKGVAMPAGRQGESCVRAEETDEMIGQSMRRCTLKAREIDRDGAFK